MRLEANNHKAKDGKGLFTSSTVAVAAASSDDEPSAKDLGVLVDGAGITSDDNRVLGEATIEQVAVLATEDSGASSSAVLEQLRAELRAKDEEIARLHEELEDGHGYRKEAVATAKAAQALKGIEMIERMQDEVQGKVDNAVAARETSYTTEISELQQAMQQAQIDATRLQEKLQDQIAKLEHQAEETQRRHAREIAELKVAAGLGDQVPAGPAPPLEPTLQAADADAGAAFTTATPPPPALLQRLMTEASLLLGNMQLVRLESTTNMRLLPSPPADKAKEEPDVNGPPPP